MAKPQHTVINLDATALRKIKAADVRAWPAGWALTCIYDLGECAHAMGWNSGDEPSVSRIAIILRSKRCIAATLAYPEVK